MSSEAIAVERKAITFTEVTLRDGEQQDKIMDIMPVADRLAVFDQIIETGIKRVEIGHLGNHHDVEFTKALITHLNQHSQGGDSHYDAVELQVLFGSQVELIDQGLDALNDFDADRVVVHVYDRASPNLRVLAAEPYSILQSAKKVVEAASVALGHGYYNFSISGEGTVDPDLGIDEALEVYYLPIIDQLKQKGANSININLPNTFGSSLEGEWGSCGLRVFNRSIKNHAPDVTTSVHVHNDHNNAAEYAMAALQAGFDTVEGTMIGMGERAGNVALSDVMVRLLENARNVIEVREKGSQATSLARNIVQRSIWIDRHLSESVGTSLDKWHASSQRIADIYGTQNRFHKTSLGNSEAYAAGSGPHAQANQEALRDPVANPLWKNYGRIALVHAMLGRPEAKQIIAVDADRIKQITLQTHAAGGSTGRILSDQIAECSDAARTKAIDQAQAVMQRIFELTAPCVNLCPALK